MNFPISIVIPFYKNVHDVNNVLNNIVKFVGKSDIKIEVILINDSGDGTKFDFVNEFIFQVTIINLNKNLGVTGARNVGFSLAKGDYVLFFDSDDFLIDDMLEETCKFLSLNYYDVVLFRCLDEYGKLIGDPSLEVRSSKSPNMFYGKGECLVAVKNNKINPFIGYFRGNEHVGLLRFALLKYPLKIACSNFPIRVYTNNLNGLSSKINSPQRSFLIAIAHFISAFFSLLLLEPIYSLRFLLASIYRFIRFLQSLFKEYFVIK